MPKPYSNDLRIRVINALKDRIPQRKISEMFSISLESVKRWWKIYKLTGIVKPKQINITKPRKVNYEELKRYVESNPDKTLKEIGKKFNIHLTAVFYIFKKLNITYKKKVFIRGEGRRIKS